MLTKMSLFFLGLMLSLGLSFPQSAAPSAPSAPRPPTEILPAVPQGSIISLGSTAGNKFRNECGKPGFSVRKAKRSNLKAPGQVHFQEVLTNAGGWSSNQNAFVAKCAGIYFFTFNAVSQNEKDFTMALMKNGKFQVTAYGGKSGYQWGSNSALLFLNPGDEVYLDLQEGTIYEHPYEEAYTSFTGFLVSEI